MLKLRVCSRIVRALNLPRGTKFENRKSQSMAVTIAPLWYTKQFYLEIERVNKLLIFLRKKGALIS